MKKIILLTALVFTIGVVNAQSFRFGLTTSANFAWMGSKSKAVDPDGTIVNFSFGALAERAIGIGSNYSVQSGIVIANVGGGLKFERNTYETDTLGTITGANDVKYTYKLRYLEIPLALKLKTNELGMFKYYGIFGMEPAFRIAAKATVEGSPFDDDDVFVNSEDFSAYDGGIFSDDVGPIKLSMIVGGGVEYTIDQKTIAFAGIRYNDGFTDILTDKSVNGKSRYFSVQLGIFF